MNSGVTAMQLKGRSEAVWMNMEAIEYVAQLKFKFNLQVALLVCHSRFT